MGEEGRKGNHHANKNKLVQANTGTGGAEVTSTSEDGGGGALETTDTNAPSNKAAVSREARQVWVHAFVWHQTRTS